MKRIIGFALFCMSMGMLLMIVIENVFLGLIISAGLMLAGYYLFCCGK